VLAALEGMKTRIVVAPEIRRRALGAIEKMISL
jgi:quinolinate synthase